MPTLIIDYRLAPEHPYPSAVEDALNAYTWLVDSGAASRIALVADSSAGGLALSTLLARRDRGTATDDPLVNQLTADLTGPPPMLIQAGSGDSSSRSQPCWRSAPNPSGSR